MTKLGEFVALSSNHHQVAGKLDKKIFIEGHLEDSELILCSSLKGRTDISPFLLSNTDIGTGHVCNICYVPKNLK